MALNGKQKGAAGEREAIQFLQPFVNRIYGGYGINPPTLARNLEQSRGGGYDIVGLEWLALEIKRVEILAVDDWWGQTTRQARWDQVPLLMYRQNRKPWSFVLPMFDGDRRSFRAELRQGDFIQWFAHQVSDQIRSQIRSTSQPLGSDCVA